ncbi:MAG: CHAD domain-containing protein [Anaerolineae bacterium]
MEVEAKFIIPDEQTFQQLLEATSLAGFGLAEGTVAELHDRYLDTAGGALWAGGYACRIRRQDSQTLVTLKGLGTVTGAVHRRTEHEVDLPEALPPQNWPSSVARDLALRLSGGEPLFSRFEIEQTRHQRGLYQGERAVAELNLDRVRLCRGDVVSPSFLELEVELLPHGDEQDLDRLAIELHERWGLLPQTRSKFERGLALFGAEPASSGESSPDIGMHPPPEQSQAPPNATVELMSQPGIEPDDPMSEAGRKTFRFHLQRMLYSEPGTRLGEDIEALHDMRVATRRMRAAFRVFGEYYEPKAVAPYLKGLKRTGRALGPVRDLDVFRAKVGAYLSTLPEAQQGSLDGFLAALEAQRAAARGRMIAYLDSQDYARFRERFGQFVETEGMASRPVTLNDGDPIPYRVRHVAPMDIYQRLAAVRAYDEWVKIPWTDLPDPPLKRLHALRIAGKRLRYALEFFGEVLGPDSSALVKEIVTMQDHLGDLQDAVVARRILREYLQRGAWGPSVAAAADGESSPGAPLDAAGVEAYLAAKQAELEHLLNTFPQVWQRITGTEFSQGVADAVVVL